MHDNNISILDGSTFLVSSANGDVDAGPDQLHGLFYKDMRHFIEVEAHHQRHIARCAFNGWPLSITTLSTSVFRQPVLSARPHYLHCSPPFVGDGFVEELTVLDHGTEAEEIELRLDAESHFARS